MAENCIWGKRIHIPRS